MPLLQQQFYYPCCSSVTLVLSQIRVCMPGGPSLRLKRTEREADHSYLMPTLLMDGVLRLMRREILWPVNGRSYLATYKSLPGSRGSSVGVSDYVTRYTTEEFFLREESRTSVRSTKEYPGVRRPRYELNLIPPTSAKVMNECSCTFNPAACLHGLNWSNVSCFLLYKFTSDIWSRLLAVPALTPCRCRQDTSSLAACCCRMPCNLETQNTFRVCPSACYVHSQFVALHVSLLKQQGVVF
jgi:hypothetical protein